MNMNNFVRTNLGRYKTRADTVFEWISQIIQVPEEELEQIGEYHTPRVTNPISDPWFNLVKVTFLSSCVLYGSAAVRL